MTIWHVALIVITTLIWGANFVVIKWGVGDIDAAAMTALRFVLVAFPLVFFVEKPSVPIKVIAGYGVLFGCGIWGLINYSISLGTPAGLASLLLQLSVFMTALAGVFVFNEKVSFNKAAGIFLAFVGFMLIVAQSFSTESSLGVFLVFLAAVSWTGCNVIIKAFKPKDALGFIVWSSLFVPIPIIIFAFIQSPSILTEMHIPGWKGIVSVLFQAVVTTIFGYWVWTKMIVRYGLAQVSPFSLIVPISGLFFSWLVYGETLGSLEIGGVAFVISGLVLVSGIVPERKKERAA